MLFMIKKIKYLFIALWLIACNEDQPTPPNYDSDKFQACDDLITVCFHEGEYCLFGYKWGDGNNFSEAGIDVEGPQTAGGIVSYSIQTSAESVSNHQQENVPTKDFGELPDCALDKIRKAFQDWASVANIEFEELEDDSDSDIKIFVSAVRTKGNGFPNFESSPCNQLAGHMILSPSYTYDCQIFYAYVLHELGHVLGLGHSDPENLMGSINTNAEGLKDGDIKGIRAIYGE